MACVCMFSKQLNFFIKKTVSTSRRLWNQVQLTIVLAKWIKTCSLCINSASYKVTAIMILHIPLLRLKGKCKASTESSSSKWPGSAVKPEPAHQSCGLAGKDVRGSESSVYVGCGPGPWQSVRSLAGQWHEMPNIIWEPPVRKTQTNITLVSDQSFLESFSLKTLTL